MVDSTFCWCLKKFNTDYMELLRISNNGHCVNNGCFQDTVCKGKIGTSGANTTNLFNYLKRNHQKENAKSLITQAFSQRHGTAA